MINSGQVKTRLGKKKADGSIVYGNLQDTIVPLIPIQGDAISFTMGADGNNISLAGANLPNGFICRTGGLYEAVNGGLICANGTIGLHSTDTQLVGGRVANISIVLNSEDDEVVNVVLSGTGKVEKRRYIYALWSTDLADADATADNKVQLSFVAWNDATHALEAVDLEAGDYTVKENRAYNVGTLADGQKNGLIETAYSIGGYAHDELLDMADDKPMLLVGTCNTEGQLQGDRIVIVTIGTDAGSSGMADSGGAVLDMTIVQKETIIFEATDINKTLYEVTGGTAVFNHGQVNPIDVAIKSANTIEVNLSGAIDTNLLYVGDYISISILGK